jgi:sterol carrier protein 2
MALRTDRGGIAGKSCMDLVGFSMTRDAAAAAFAEAGMQRERVAVVELHDCFSANELISYEALGLCEPGGAAAMVERGDNTYGGRCEPAPAPQRAPTQFHCDSMAASKPTVMPVANPRTFLRPAGTW